MGMQIIDVCCLYTHDTYSKKSCTNKRTHSLLYNYIRKLREVLSKDKEISITTQNNGYELHIST